MLGYLGGILCSARDPTVTSEFIAPSAPSTAYPPRGDRLA